MVGDKLPASGMKGYIITDIACEPFFALSPHTQIYGTIESVQRHVQAAVFHTTRVRDKDCVKNRVKRAKIVRFTLC